MPGPGAWPSRREEEPEVNWELLSFLSTGLGLSQTSKRGVKTAAKMKSKHLQVWEFPRKATTLPSLPSQQCFYTARSQVCLGQLQQRV